MVAIIETGGKQYCVQPGQKLEVERLTASVGETVSFANLLVAGSDVAVEVLKHKLGDKVITRKFRNKTRNNKVRGHRQTLTLIQVKNETAHKAASASKSKTSEAA
ncbi:MAG TPA: 50S ribosomal protein L21 [Patescibacteria group bacterium]